MHPLLHKYAGGGSVHAESIHIEPDHEALEQKLDEEDAEQMDAILDHCFECIKSDDKEGFKHCLKAAIDLSGSEAFEEEHEEDEEEGSGY